MAIIPNVINPKSHKHLHIIINIENKLIPNTTSLMQNRYDGTFLISKTSKNIIRINDITLKFDSITKIYNIATVNDSMTYPLLNYIKLCLHLLL